MSVEIRPQPGPQTQFLATSADIAIYGGAAGGGKSYALLLEPLRHVQTRGFGAVIFRRTSPQIRNQGGLWDKSIEIYQPLGARPVQTLLDWHFPSRATISFRHLEHESTRLEWQGAQLAFVGWDELTHFTETQFFYLVSRNRSTCGVRPYIRATTNPDPDSWVKKFISWWIDGATGLPIVERSGVLRWMLREGDEIHWFGTRDEALAARAELSLPAEVEPKSVTFIRSDVRDNRILLEKDPAYLANLYALPKVEREQLLGGNWNVRPSAGMFFQRAYFRTFLDSAPRGVRFIRYWDFAATEPEPGKDPDWTVGTKIGVQDGRPVIADVTRIRGTPAKVEAHVRATAELDGYDVDIVLEEEPGSAGKSSVSSYQRHVLEGFTVHGNRATGDKVTNAGPLSSRAEAGDVVLVRAAWNEPFILEAEAFPDGAHDDQVDSASKGYNWLTRNPAHVDYEKLNRW